MLRIDKEQLLELFDETTHDRLLTALQRGEVHGFIVYQNDNFSSRSFGARSAVMFGPGCTFKSVSQSARWLNDLPSQRQQRKCYFIKAAGYTVKRIAISFARAEIVINRGYNQKVYRDCTWRQLHRARMICDRYLRRYSPTI